MLYAKRYIYLEKLNENRNQNGLNIDLFGYLSHLKYILKIEKVTCILKIKVLGLSNLMLYMIISQMYAC